ncbi:MAG: DUF2132 domain-containing protein [Deltaproteobacteria bacterium]|nr:DUF2132 domain-containing protein [Deltaproteobacteria bacterium]
MNQTHNSKFIIHNLGSDPLHGITLKMMVTELVGHFGWEELGRRIEIRCFTHDPSIPSSLKFLRRTPWARDKVEELYLRWRMGDMSLTQRNLPLSEVCRLPVEITALTRQG